MSKRASPRRSALSLLAVLAGVLVVVLAELSGSGAAQAGAPEPTLGSSERLTLIAGVVSVRQKGSTAFVPLKGTLLVPDESEVDARRGRVEVTVAATNPGEMESATAYQGRFVIHQDATAPGETHLVLSQPIAACAAAHRAAIASAAGHRHRSAAGSRHLWVSDNGGQWGTNGKYVSTSVEGTRWLTSDECHRSAVRVASGVVLVRDLIHHVTATVSAGHQYVAGTPEEGAGFVPLPGRVLAGETGGDPEEFKGEVGKHGAIFGFFGSWGGEFGSLLGYVERLHARLLLHLSTDVGYGSSAGEVISPRAIAIGEGDSYLMALGRELSTSRVPVYVAFLPEMNQANNAYSAFSPSGSARGRSNSTSAFRQAWRRATLILRGGAVNAIDGRLRRLGLPPLRGSRGGALPQPKVSMMWAPQTAGTPAIPANGPAAYYPGSAYVDIVGTDFYSAFPNFSGLSSMYNAYPTKPFGFNEWGMWKSGDPGFVSQLFHWVHSHRRVALMVYNEGLTFNGPFRLSRFPAARRAIRRELRSASFLAYPPGAEPTFG